MTHDELLGKAIEWLRKVEPRMPDQFLDVTIDRLPTRRVREAVVIDFSSEEGCGSIQVVLERETGDLIRASHTPPKARHKDVNDG